MENNANGLLHGLENAIAEVLYIYNSDHVLVDGTDRLAYLYGLRSLKDVNRISRHHGIFFVSNPEGKEVKVRDLTMESQEKLLNSLPDMERIGKMLRQMADFRDATGKELSLRDGHPYSRKSLDLGEEWGNLDSMPDDLEVNGFLDLYRSSLRVLPANLKVNGSLDISRTEIRSLPSDIKVEGDINAYDSLLKELPDNLRVKGDLILEQTHVESLPRNLVVDGSLNLEKTDVYDLPSDLKVKDQIVSHRGQIIASWNTPKSQEGYLDLNKAPYWANVERPHMKNPDLGQASESSGLSHVNDLPLRITFGTWPGPSNITGDVHVEIGKVMDRELLRYIEGLAFDTGGSKLRKQGESHWADFFDRSSAESFVERAGLHVRQEEMAQKFCDIGMNGIPLFLLKPIRHEWSDTDGRIFSETLGSVMIDSSSSSSIMLYSGMDEAERRHSPTSLKSLSPDDQRQVLSELSECLEHFRGNNLQVEPSEVFRTRASAPLDNNGDYSRMLRQMADFKAATGLDIGVGDGHPFFAGDLFLENSEIKTLPDNLEVDGFLNLSFSQITELPSNLKLHGGLYLENTRIKSLPSTLTRVPGDLNLINSEVETLPDNLKVDGWLDLRNSNIRELPKGLTVGYYLNLDNTQVSALPSDLRVNSRINFNETVVWRSPSNISREGFIDLARTGLPLEQGTGDPRLLSPLMKQYADFKRNYPNVVPLFHIGDGYETYQEDARKVAGKLGVPVIRNETQRDIQGNVAEAVSVPERDFLNLLKSFHSDRISYSVLEEVNRGKDIDSQGTSVRSVELDRELPLERNEKYAGGMRR